MLQGCTKKPVRGPLLVKKDTDFFQQVMHLRCLEICAVDHYTFFTDKD